MRRRRASQVALFGLPFAALVLAVLLNGGTGPFANPGVWWEIAVPALSIAVLLPTVLVALHHAESAAARLGEPYGTLLLTMAVTVIEVSIIVFVMLNGENNPTLARESVFSVVMIVTSGGIGICLTLGALRYGEQEHKLQGTSAYLAVLIALSVLLLMLPNFTLTTPPGTFSVAQLVFVSALSVLLYLAFLYIQSVRHRAYFVDAGADANPHAQVRTLPPLYVSISCLIAALVAVVLLAERVAVGVEGGLAALGVARQDAIIGALIAALLLFPEMLAAVRATLANQLQRSINIILGSAVATIGLTIPAVAVISLITHHEIILGLIGRDEVMLVLAFTLSIISFGTGRTNVLTGFVHLVIFFAYLLLLAIP
jgi:Ca2+:H+ antiporter